MHSCLFLGLLFLSDLVAIVIFNINIRSRKLFVFFVCTEHQKDLFKQHMADAPKVVDSAVKKCDRNF